MPTLFPLPQTAFYLQHSKRQVLEEAIQVMYMINSYFAYNGMTKENVVSNG